jgi:hypothetical protein
MVLASRADACDVGAKVCREGGWLDGWLLVDLGLELGLLEPCEEAKTEETR